MAVAEAPVRRSAWNELLATPAQSVTGHACGARNRRHRAARKPSLFVRVVCSKPAGQADGMGFTLGSLIPTRCAARGAVTTRGYWAACRRSTLPMVPVSQALGHRAALDWTHLRVPWWNPYEGTGMPLAGEMQSGALSPRAALADRKRTAIRVFLRARRGYLYLLPFAEDLSRPVGERRGRGRVRPERHLRLVLPCCGKSGRVLTPFAPRY